MTSIYIHSLLLVFSLLILTVSMFLEDYSRQDMVTIFIAFWSSIYSIGYLTLMIAIVTKGAFV